MTTPQGLAVLAAQDAATAHLLDRGLTEISVVFEALLDVADLDATTPDYLRVATATVQRSRATAAAVSQDFYAALRLVEAPGAAPLPPAFVPEPPTPLVEASLRVTGPVTAKAAIARGATPPEAMTAALKATLGAVTRHVEGGPRDVARINVVRDPEAGGWLRRSGGSPCPFCAMLISRGPVYKHDTAGFRSHDHCHCKAVPFFGSDPGWTAQSAEYQDLWRASNGTLQDFGRLYRRRYGDGGPAALPLAA